MDENYSHIAIAHIPCKPDLSVSDYYRSSGKDSMGGNFF